MCVCVWVCVAMCGKHGMRMILLQTSKLTLPWHKPGLHEGGRPGRVPKQDRADRKAAGFQQTRLLAQERVHIIFVNKSRKLCDAVDTWLRRRLV
jgi:hypothetical protein